MLDCDQALELISAKIDNELTPQEEAALAEHLAACPACGALLAEFELMHDAMPEPAVPPAGLTEQIMDQVRRSKVVPLEPQKQPKKAVHWKRWASIAAVLALVLLGAGPLRSWSAGGMSGGSSGSAAAPAAAGAEPASAPESAAPISSGTEQSVQDVERALPENAPAEQKSSIQEADSQTGGTPSVSGYSGGTGAPPSPEPVPSISAASVPPQTPAESPALFARTMPDAALLGDAGLTGPWHGILVLPEEYADALEGREFTQADSWRCYVLPAGEFDILAEQAGSWDGAALLTEDNAVSPSAEEGLVLVEVPAQ